MGMLLRRHRREDGEREELTAEEVAGLQDVVEEEVEETGEYFEVPASEVVFPRPTGGGWYELSNGEKVQGKGDAELREVELLTEEVEEEEENLEEGD